MPSVGGMPTLSQVRSWATTHLTEAATRWTTTATLWEDAFTEMAAQMNHPGGASWVGVAAEAAQRRAYTDRLKVVGLADQLHDAARAARAGATQIDEARRLVLRTVAAAENAGFTVGEDFSVTDPNLYEAGTAAARQAQAEAFATDLPAGVGGLVATDSGVAGQLTSATAGLGSVAFPESGGPSAPDAPTADVPPQDPAACKRWWDSLTPEQKEPAYDADHAIGNHGGIPFPVRDLYNQRHLPELMAAAEAEVERLSAQHPSWADGHPPAFRGDFAEYRRWKGEWDNAVRSRDGFVAVDKVLKSPAPEGTRRYLSFIDDKGHGAVSIGNPDTAKRTATFVPGTGQDLAAFEGSDGKSLDMFQAALKADRSLKIGDVAVTTWMGYDRPMDLLQAASPSRAVNGGAALDSYVDGMHASHVGPAAIDTVIGHSYGSTLVGGAATSGHHLAADNVIAVGSPGMLTTYAQELALDPGAHVYAVTARNDVIQLATDMTLGGDPAAFTYGATRLNVDPGPALPHSGGLLPSVAAHSSYWSDENPALRNMGAIIAGMPPPEILDATGHVITR